MPRTNDLMSEVNISMIAPKNPCCTKAFKKLIQTYEFKFLGPGTGILQKRGLEKYYLQASTDATCITNVEKSTFCMENSFGNIEGLMAALFMAKLSIPEKYLECRNNP